MIRTIHPRRFLASVAVAVPVIVAVMAVMAVGCSEAASPGVGSTAQAKAAVRDFLEAIKRGDDAAARGMLTEVARAKTAEMGLSIAPPVAATATYSIRECEPIGDTGEVVHVSTTWTDTDPDGFASTDEVIWVTRLDPEGWRVVGLAMKVFPDTPPLLLDFEDPEDMIAKQRSVAMEIQRRAKAAASQSAGPQSSSAAASGGGKNPTQRISPDQQDRNRQDGVRTGGVQPPKTVQ